MADIELKEMASRDEMGKCGASDQGKSNSSASNKEKLEWPQQIQTITDEDGRFEISTGNGKEKSHVDRDLSDQRPESDPLPQSNTTAQPYCLATETLEATSQGQDETLVTVPIAKLQQLVEYGIKVLQESRKRIKIVQMDPERDSTEAVHDKLQLLDTAVEPKNTVSLASSSLESNTKGIERIIATSDRAELARTKIIGRIHDHPWPIKNIEIDAAYLIDKDLLNGLSKLETFHEHYEVAWSKYFVDFFVQELPHSHPPEIRKVWLRRRLSSWLFSRPSARLDTGNLTAVLISCMNYENSNLRWTEIKAHTIGSIIEFCYKNKTLEQPRLPQLTHSITEIAKYQLQMKTVILAISVLNDCFDPQHFYLLGPELIEEHPIEEILALSLTELRTFFQTPMFNLSKLEIATGNTTQNDSLNIIALRTIGNLKIYWTDYIEEHLILNVSRKILYLAYPRLHQFSQFGRLQTSLIDSCEICPHEKKEKFDDWSYAWMNDGIAASWAMIFSYRYAKLKCQKSYFYTALRFLHFAKDPMIVLKRAYESISFAPDPYFHPDGITYPWQSDYRDPAHLDRAEIEIISNYHVSTLVTMCITNRASDAHHQTDFHYSQFDIFENRVRQLKFYMDSQKPRGFRQLWRDKRDALNYYTFWGVIIFGASTLFLAIVSLAVSAAQAVAAFKALDIPPSSH